MKKLVILFAAIIGSLLMQSCLCEYDLWDYGYGPTVHVHTAPPPPPPHHHHRPHRHYHW
ncbi:MAG: hypothetical protein J6M19_00240 [Bacteroidaceae bacterium]|nr:hypothetical protein [Bacteroidaceae bacterium]